MQPVFAGKNALILLRNYASEDLGAVASATSTARGTTMSASGALSERSDRAWRSGPLSSAAENPRLRVDLPRARPISTIGLFRSGTLARVTARVYRTPEATANPVVETGWVDAVIRATPGEYSWTEMPWALGPDRYSLEERAQEFRLHSLIPISPVVPDARAIEIEWDRTWDRGPNDFVQLGDVYAGEAFRPRINYSLGAALQVDDLTEVGRTDAGRIFGRERPRLRRFTFSLNFLDRDELFRAGGLWSWALEGRQHRVFIWPEPDHRADFHATAFLGTGRALPSHVIERLGWPASPGIEIEEVP